MPELPEVETTRRGLEPHLVGRTFTGAILDWPAAVAYPDPDTFVSRLSGRTVVALDRRGKHLVLVLDDGSRLIAHLRMTGRLMLTDQHADIVPYTRNRLLLDRGQELRFVDLRKFGQLWLLRPDEGDRLPYRASGPEPLDPGFTPARLRDALRSRTGTLKGALLDQHVLAGLGNIYVDEALFEAGLHPERTPQTLTNEELERLHAAIVSVLERGIANAGTSFRDFAGPLGVKGSNQEDLRVWHRSGEPCRRCGATVIKTRVAGRGTHLCPRCQPATT